MREIGKSEIDELLGFKETKKSDIISTANKLNELSSSLIDEFVKYRPEEIYELKVILFLRDPETETEIEEYKIAGYLSNLPYHILAVHSLYLQTKNNRENLEELLDANLGTLRSKAELEIISHRLLQKEKGYPISSFGQITKEALIDRCRIFPEYSDIKNIEKSIQEIKYKEEFLKKLVDVLENRRYELGKIIEINLKGIA